ncbi:MAG: putative nucleic acid-binding protein [Gammaproteobacteria bacterium]|jgi:predicted nucleic acid-binding protein
MIILDTNVLSELMRPAPNPTVVNWIANQPSASLFTTSITQAEILYGLMRLDPGRRRDELQLAALAMFDEDLAGRVLPFGSDAAHSYARIAAERHRMGRPISQFDTQIAAIAHASGADVATRNISDFEQCGVNLINPWE